MWRVLLVVLIIIGFVAALTTTRAPTIASAETTEQQVTAPADTSVTSTGFTKTGALVFYPNNVGPVPYLFYQDTVGKTIAKALTFVDGPPYNFSSWSGARISVVGYQEQEHVVVTSIVYVSAP